MTERKVKRKLGHKIGKCPVSLMKISKCADHTTSTIRVIIERLEKGKHSIHTSEPKGNVVADKVMKLIFPRSIITPRVCT